MNARAYQGSHPWISFKIDFHAAAPGFWTQLGQAVARCGQIGGAALPPGAAGDMHTLYLVKGVQATTAIEGNTLSTEQVRERVVEGRLELPSSQGPRVARTFQQGRLELPPSQEYLGQEVDNVIRACDEIAHKALQGHQLRLDEKWIAECNRQVLAGLEAHMDEGVVAGEIPAHAVGVGRYRGAPREDCAWLLQHLCEWLEGEPDLPLFADRGADRIATAMLHAILAHLYIAWIHPFGDGNGRTARLVEFMLLARAGVPLPAAQLPSNHYNRTRTEYYRQLDRSSRANEGRGDPIGFVRYALQGLVDGLEEQCRHIDAIQLSIAWKHFVFDRFRQERRSPALNRRREIALALTDHERPVPRAELRRLGSAVAELYAGKTDMTLTRDINWLLHEDLIERRGGGYRARVDRMRSFLPPRADGTGSR